MGLPSPSVFRALVDIAIRFFDTHLSLLIRFWYVIEVKRKKVVTVTSVPYLRKTLKTSALKTSWMNDIVIFVKREKLTSDGDHPSWFRINHPNEEAKTKLYDRDRDWLV